MHLARRQGTQVGALYRGIGRPTDYAFAQFRVGAVNGITDSGGAGGGAYIRYPKKGCAVMLYGYTVISAASSCSEVLSTWWRVVGLLQGGSRRSDSPRNSGGVIQNS